MTRPLSFVVTPYHALSGLSVNQLLTVHPVFAVGGVEERGQGDAVGVAVGLFIALGVYGGGHSHRLGEREQEGDEQQGAAVMKTGR